MTSPNKKAVKRPTKLMAFAFVALLAVIYLSTSSMQAGSFLLGDVDGDGNVSAADARLLLRVAAGLVPVPADQNVFRSADMNFDGIIDAADARYILRIVANLMAIEVPKNDDVPTVPENESNAGGALHEVVTSPHVSVDYGDNTGMLEEYPIADVPAFAPSADSFVFVTYGWGHGVGMSQYAAAAAAENGYLYTDILGYYYKGTKIMKETVPDNVRMPDGSKVKTKEILARITEQEIGGITRNREALKAQIVAVYTNFKYYNYQVKNVAYKSSYSSCSESVIQAVEACLGEYLTYNGNVITAVFGAMSAGITANPTDVWGGSYPYLESVPSYDDRLQRGFIAVKSFSSEELKKKILAYDENIKLSGNPSDWIEILEHDNTISRDIGYVTALRVGDKIISSRAGQIFREQIMGYSIRSQCFTVEYYR